VSNTLYSETYELTVMRCPVCIVSYALPEPLRERCEEHRGESGFGWYCPNGHSLHYPGETAADKARKEADRAKLEAMEERDKRLAAERALAKTKKRANAGVCLDCHRTFADVARHRATKHKAVG
jgi:hypothetical protein